MSDTPVGLDRSDLILIRRPPWVRLFRGVGLSLDGRKLVLAAIGLILIGLGRWGLDLALESNSGGGPDLVPNRLAEATVDLERSAWPWASAQQVAEPLIAPARSFARLFDPTSSPWMFVRAALEIVWTLLVWGLLGGAIARIALVGMSDRGWVGLGSALRFAGRRVVALVGAPLCPFIGIGFFGLLCAMIGLLYWIPGPIGTSVAGLLGFLPLLAGLVMTLIAIGLAIGWPLMITTVVAEGEDAFDALSRSYSYVFQRPWKLAAYGALAWALGVIGLLVVRFAAALIVQLALWGLSLGAPDDRLISLFQSEGGAGFPGSVHAFWLGTVDLLAFGWIYAYFWSVVPIIYLLLRSEIDGAPFESLFFDEPPADLLPEPPGPPSTEPTTGEPTPTEVSG